VCNFWWSDFAKVAVPIPRRVFQTTKTLTTTSQVVIMSDSSTESDDEDIKKAIAMSLEDVGTPSPAKPAASDSYGKAVSNSP